MPNKMIPFSYEKKKLLILISVTMVFTIPIKIDRVEAFFILFFIFVIMTLGRIM